MAKIYIIIIFKRGEIRSPQPVSKAANFKYYGYHFTRFVRNKRSNEFIHEQILTNSTSPTGYLRNNLAYLLGDTEVYQVRTYRYIYPLCKHFKFNKPELPYPEYNKGMLKIIWKRNNEQIKNKMIELLKKFPT